METAGGIQAGVMWTIVAGIHSFIKDRWKLDPSATVIFTGGDGKVGMGYLTSSLFSTPTRSRRSDAEGRFLEGVVDLECLRCCAYFSCFEEGAADENNHCHALN